MSTLSLARESPPKGVWEYLVAALCMLDSLDDALIQQISGTVDTRARERAFRELVGRHAGALDRFLAGYERDPGRRDDLVQETFLRVYTARERYTAGAATFRTWLLTIGRNLALDARRRRGRRPEDPLEEGASGADSGSGPIKGLIAEQEASLVRAAVARLPEADREAVSLRFFEDLPHSEIARVVGSSPAAVKQRIWRAMNTLRALLAGGDA